MAVDDNKLLVRRYYEEVVNTGHVNGLADFISPEYVEVHNNTRHSIGLEGAKEHVIGVRETYPDLHLTVEQQKVCRKRCGLAAAIPDRFLW